MFRYEVVWIGTRWNVRTAFLKEFHRSVVRTFVVDFLIDELMVLFPVGLPSVRQSMMERAHSGIGEGGSSKSG